MRGREIVSERLHDLNRFYNILSQIERCHGTLRLIDSHGRMIWPRRGVYFFFEADETRSKGRVAGGNQAKARRMTQAAVRVAKLGRKYSRVLIAAEGGRLVGVLNAADWPHCQMSSGDKLKAVL